MRSWLDASWQALCALDGRMPHALLFAGPAGLGKRELADALAARLLCERPRASDGHACGECEACAWRLAGNHPDLHCVVPDALRAAEGGASDGAEGGKAASNQIRIEQIREVLAALELTSHRPGWRVVLIEPAEAMNVFTANALLKLLEEPPPQCVFVLLSTTPRRLLPTLRSRCRQWNFARPPQREIEAWAASAPAGAADLLALCAGMPLAAERLAAAGGVELLRRFVTDLAAVRADTALPLAVQWEQWLKSKEAQAAGFGLPLLADWMQRWVGDLTMLCLGGTVRFFPAQAQTLARLAGQTGAAAAHGCYEDISRIRRHSRHPLNLRLALEDMLLHYTRTFASAQPGGRR